ncbi:MAG TPA: hypothetical protein PLL56_14575, partial [Verrucomicrobiota bacterium]|nr:hypothetical protein [Verrucomicrobiota bacterium]
RVEIKILRGADDFQDCVRVDGMQFRKVLNWFKTVQGFWVVLTIQKATVKPSLTADFYGGSGGKMLADFQRQSLPSSSR